MEGQEMARDIADPSNAITTETRNQSQSPGQTRTTLECVQDETSKIARMFRGEVILQKVAQVRRRQSF